MIGGGCSPATNALIGIAEYQNIPLVSLLHNTPHIIVVLIWFDQHFLLKG